MFWGKGICDFYLSIACVAFKCRGTVSLWIMAMSVMNVVFDCFSSACAPPLHLIKVTEQNLAFAAVPEEGPAHAAELLGDQHGTQADAAASDSPIPCAHSLPWCRRTVRVIVTLVAAKGQLNASL